MSWFKPSRFIPELNRSVAVAVAPTPNALFSRVWAKRMNPTTGGQNWSLATQELARNSLSGPLPYNARRFNPLEPTTPYGPRRIIALNAYATGMATGQWWQKPLLNGGSVGKALMPVNVLPYNYSGIAPAGKA